MSKDAEVKYWIMEFKMLPETEAELRIIAKEHEMTLDEVVEVGMRGMIVNPSQIKEMMQYTHQSDRFRHSMLASHYARF